MSFESYTQPSVNAKRMRKTRFDSAKESLTISKQRFQVGKCFGVPALLGNVCGTWGAWLTGYSPSRMPAVHTPPLAPGYLAAGATISWATLRYDHSPAPPAVSLPRLWCVCMRVCAEVLRYCVDTVERVPQYLSGGALLRVPRRRRCVDSGDDQRREIVL